MRIAVLPWADYFAGIVIVADIGPRVQGEYFVGLARVRRRFVHARIVEGVNVAEGHSSPVAVCACIEAECFCFSTCAGQVHAGVGLSGVEAMKQTCNCC